MKYQYFDEEYDAFLEHSGIPGMKWHHRRWQNEDGSWTPAGREKYGKGGAPRGRYKDDKKNLPAGKGREGLSGKDFDGDDFRRVDISDPSKLSKEDKEFLREIGFFEANPHLLKDLDGDKHPELKGASALDKGESAYKNTKEYIEAITEDCWSPHASAVKADKDRIDEAATLGVLAIDKLRGPGYIDTDDGITEGHKEWFLYEDQTDGLPMIADLINRGYTSKQVNKLIDELDKWDDTRRELMQNPDSKAAGPIFEVQNADADELKRFAKICEDVKNDKSVVVPQTKKSSNSKIRESVSYLKEQADTLADTMEDRSSTWHERKEASKKFENSLYMETMYLITSKGFSKDDAVGSLKDSLSEYAEKSYGSNSRKEIDKILKSVERRIGAQVKNNNKLEKTQDKLDAAKEKQNSPAYLNNSEKRDKLERQLEALGLKTTKIRDNKLFNDKEPGFFDRMKLNKEARLQKKLAKVNKKINKVDDSVNKLTKKQDKYQQKVDKQYKYDEQTREAMRIANEKGWKALTDKQKELIYNTREIPKK